MEGDEAEGEGAAAPAPRTQFRPGRDVWAKVEGHDWWPARIVRRRAVPREVCRGAEPPLCERLRGALRRASGWRGALAACSSAPSGPHSVAIRACVCRPPPFKRRLRLPHEQHARSCCLCIRVRALRTAALFWRARHASRPRRAPARRQVGPPPGAPAHVRSHMPVVFFTARGIPGEVGEGMDSLEGALAACMRAVSFVGAHPPRLPPARAAPMWVCVCACRQCCAAGARRSAGRRAVPAGCACWRRAEGHCMIFHTEAWRQAPRRRHWPAAAAERGASGEGVESGYGGSPAGAGAGRRQRERGGGVRVAARGLPEALPAGRHNG